MTVQNQETDAPPPLHIPEGICYNCVACGVCCGIFTHIPVSDDVAEQWETLPPQPLQDANCEVSTPSDGLVIDPTSGERVLRRTENIPSRCVFQDPEGKCIIHRVYGYNLKPHPCRDFPFRFVEAPDGVYVGLSFVCPTVRANRGLPLVEQEAGIADALRTAGKRHHTPESILLNEHIKLTWDDYLELEKALVQLLENHDVPLRQRLIALNILVNFVSTYDQHVRGTYAPFEPPRFLRTGELRELLDAMRKKDFAEIRRLSSRPRSSPMVQRMFLGMLTSFANSLWQPGRTRVLAGITTQYIRHAVGLGRVQLNPIDARVSHRSLASVALPEAGPAAELLLRYARHCIFRKDLLLAPNVNRGVNLLLLNCALTRWYAAAVAQQRRVSSPGPDEFSEAIRHIEMLYGFHSKFYQFFREQVAVEEVVESFTRRRNYPFVILGN